MTTRRPSWMLGGLMLLASAITAGCAGERYEAHAAAITGGEPERGRALIRQYGCGSCHTIPGVPGAMATVGPPLAGIATRAYLGGVLQNSPANMMTWIQDPKVIDEKTAMPDLGVTPEHARDIAAYLYTLH
jgi:cytochrome c